MSKKEVNLYNTMFEYVFTATIDSYDEVQSWQPADQPDFCVYHDDEIKVYDEIFVRVNWGENREEKHYMNRRALGDYIWTYGTEIYENEDDAMDEWKKDVQENIDIEVHGTSLHIKVYCENYDVAYSVATEYMESIGWKYDSVEYNYVEFNYINNGTFRMICHAVENS